VRNLSNQMLAFWKEAKASQVTEFIYLASLLKFLKPFIAHR
jgi:hypothetical protein